MIKNGFDINKVEAELRRNRKVNNMDVQQEQQAVTEQIEESEKSSI